MYKRWGSNLNSGGSIMYIVKVMCGSYAYNRITNRRFNGRLRMKENTEYSGETVRAKT